MNIGIFSGPSGRLLSVAELVEDVRAAAAAGFRSYWVPQMPWGPDALTALSHAGAAVPGIELGTAVIPTYPRHPIVLAQQALTVTSIIGDRLALGIGLSHKPVIEGQFGYSFERPLLHLREYLQALAPQLANEKVSFKGETLTARNPRLLAAPRPKVYVAALGPQMLRLTGAMADGTIPWMTGNRTLAELTVPTIREAAERAGRPAPRVAVGLPVLCTEDAAAGRELAAKVFALYGSLPSYRAMLDREGLAAPEEMAVIGDESAVRAQLEAVFEAGATDVLAAEFGASPEDLARTRACLAALL
ncbi:MAG: TIGR03564 family F420-dependent LLM class oxidoreductase [Acidimicrobiales bacterium]